MKDSSPKEPVQPFRFKQGNLSGIGLYLNTKYRLAAYPDGNTDVRMIEDIKNSDPEGKVIFDVGTFIGASSLVFAKMIGKKGKVVGFEPNPYNRERIKLNLGLNKDLSSRILISSVALSNVEGNMTMTISREIDNGHSSTSRLNQSHPTLHNDQLPSDFEEIKVETKTLDNYVKETSLHPDIIKIDIEGAEYEFLEGGRKTIHRYKPVLYVEIHSEFCAIKCMDFFNSEGYHYVVLHEEDDNRVMIRAYHSKESLYSINNNLVKSIEERDSIIKNLENSLSWKITKPIRFVKSKLSLSKANKTNNE